MVVGQSWRQIEGEVFDGRVRVGPLLNAGREALFSAEWVGISAPDILVRIYPATSEPVLERHMEASFLEHPNMLRCFGAGEFQHDGQRLVYAVLARFEETLADILQKNPLDPAEALRLGRELSSALAYLHHHDLVFCNLDPANITRTGGVWQLADYSQLRVAGRGYMNETRRLIAARPTTPPEAYEGVVLPNWDSWGLACVLSTALSGLRRESRTARQNLPEPFHSIVTECLSGDPQHRCGMERIRMLLDSAAMAATPTGAVPVDQPAPLSRPTHRRPIRYLVPEADEGAAPSEPEVARAPEPGPQDEKLTLRDWWEQHGILTVAAAVAAVALLVLLLTYLPRHTNATSSVGAPPVIEKPTPQRVSEKPTPERPVPQALIRNVLDDWTTASRQRDAVAQSELYAPKVDRFFNTRNVTRDWIRRYREEAYGKIANVRKFDLSNVKVTLKDPSNAEVTFDKAWDFAGSLTPRSGHVRSQLLLKKMDDDWRIVSERDIKIHSVAKSR
jgi:serine/threonine protein kinase